MTRYRYLDWLRTLSAFAVVAVHVLSHYLGGFTLKSPMWTLTMLLKHSTHFCIPAFFMISGVLLIKPLEKKTYKEYLKKRYLRICIPFVIWSVIHWLIITVLVQGNPFSVTELIRLFLSNGISSQYWYVYATLILYLFLPFIGTLVTSISRKQLRILIVVMITVNLLLPYANELLKIFTKWKITNYNMSSMGAYLTYALIGYALHTTKLPNKKTRYLIYSGGAGAWMLMNVLCWIASEKKYTGTFSETQYPLSLMLGIAVFVAVKAICEKRAEASNGTLIRILSTESYTAYLTHMLCLRLLQIPWKTAMVVSLEPYHAAGVMLAEWALGVIGCFGIAWIVHRLPKRISTIL